MEQNDTLTRSAYLEGKKVLTDDDIANLIEIHHEYTDVKTLKRYTDKKYRDLTTEEKKQLVISLLSSEEYLKYKNCFIAKSKLLYDSSETLIKETSALSRLNGLGYEVYLLPYAYARDNMNCYQKSADSITAGEFLEMKSVTSIGTAAGESAFRDARNQANIIYLSIVNENTEDKIVNNIKRSIGSIKADNKKHGYENNFKGFVFLNFEKEDKISLYEISKEGKLKKSRAATYAEFKKIKGTAYDSSQVVVDPLIKQGSLPKTNLSEKKSVVNVKVKGTAYDSSQVVENPMTEHGSSRNSNIAQNEEKSNQKSSEGRLNENVSLSKPITIVVTQYDEKHNPITDNNGNPVTATLHCNKGLGVALGTLVHRNAVLERDNELLRKQLNMYKTNNISQADDNSWSDR